ncbi:hypothetical protein LguiA_036516 [Lonicera macranthoides]
MRDRDHRLEMDGEEGDCGGLVLEARNGCGDLRIGRGVRREESTNSEIGEYTTEFVEVTRTKLPLISCRKIKHEMK